MRRLWTEDNVTFVGKYFTVEDVTILPRPWQKNGLPIWIGGRSEAALKRTGRLGDGWLVSGGVRRLKLQPGDRTRFAGTPPMPADGSKKTTTAC